MPAYYDTSVLLPLYVEEAFSAAIQAYAAAHGAPVPVCAFQELEIENALRLKVFRGDIDEGEVRRVWLDYQEDLLVGRVISRPANWVQVLAEARLLAQRITPGTGCRTLDLLHVAVARQWGCELFVSADERQLAAAAAAGLTIVNLRVL